jgi:hypothetical protein
MEQTQRRSMHAHFPYPFRIGRFASEEQIPETEEGLGTFPGGLIEYGGSQEQSRYLVLPQESAKFRRRQGDFLGQANKMGSIEERSPDFEGGGIKGRAGGLCDAVIRRDADVIRIAYQPVYAAL